MTAKDFILASGSPQRIALLRQIGFEPKKIQPADIDETPRKFEKASSYVKRMALEKARHVAELNPGEVVLACDTVVVAGGKIIQKCHSEEEQEAIMRRLSGRPHRVLSAVCVIDRSGHEALKLNVTKVYIKKFSEEEIKAYVASHEWEGCSGFKIEGQMGAYISRIIGSYPSVVGLPLYETRNMLTGVGIK